MIQKISQRMKLSQICTSIVLVCLVFSLISCAGKLSYNHGEEAFQKNDYAAAVQYYMTALHHEPANPRYRIALAKAILAASNHHTELAKKFLEEGDRKQALIEYQKALDFNPENTLARQTKLHILKEYEQEQRGIREKEESARRAKLPNIQGTIPAFAAPDKPISLRFNDVDIRAVLRALEKVGDVRFLFDEGVQSHKMTIDLKDLNFIEALESILLQGKLLYKAISSKTVIIYPDTPAKRRQFEDVIISTFFLNSAKPEPLQTLLKSVTDIKTISINTELNAITVRDTPRKVDIVSRLIAIHDKPRGEVLLDVEILEVNRNRMREYGIDLSQYQITQSFSPIQGGVSASGTTAASGVIRGNQLPYLGSSDFLFSLPTISYKLLQSDSQSRIIARPQLRAVDQEEVSIRLGDKVPIPTTTWVPYASGGPNGQPITSFQLQDIGINIDFSPKIQHDGWILLKLKFELSFITSPGTSSLPPTIGNRMVSTVIRLRDNESSLLAGLLRDTERSSLRGIPFLAKVPIIKDIFSSNTGEVTQTDIILTITPHILSLPDIWINDQAPIWVGTEENLGLRDAPPPTLDSDGKVSEQKETPQ